MLDSSLILAAGSGTSLSAVLQHHACLSHHARPIPGGRRRLGRADRLGTMRMARQLLAVATAPAEQADLRLGCPGLGIRWPEITKALQPFVHHTLCFAWLVLFGYSVVLGMRVA